MFLGTQFSLKVGMAYSWRGAMAATANHGKKKPEDKKEEEAAEDGDDDGRSR